MRLPQRPAHARRQPGILALPIATPKDVSAPELFVPYTKRAHCETPLHAQCQSQSHSSRAPSPPPQPLPRNAARLRVLLRHRQTHFLRRPKAVCIKAWRRTYTAALRARTLSSATQQCCTYGHACVRPASNRSPDATEVTLATNGYNACPSASFSPNLQTRCALRQDAHAAGLCKPTACDIPVPSHFAYAICRPQLPTPATDSWENRCPYTVP